MIYIFSSSRLSAGNSLFPVKITIDTIRGIISIRKGRLIGSDQMSLHSRSIVSISISKFNELLIFSEIMIVTPGNLIRLNGFTNEDATKIKSLIESLLG